MHGAGTTLFWMQFVWQAPVLLAYLVAMGVAVVYWRRYPTPSKLTLAACGLLFAVSVGQTILQLVLFQQRADLGVTPEQMSVILNVSNFVSSMLRTGALGLLVAAVYSGRTTVPRQWVEE